MGFDTIFHRTSPLIEAHTTVLLDGGLGTTLEDDFNTDISHPLWSAKLVDRQEDIIIDAHLAFLRAGSQVILASTYQAAYETFRRAGYADVDAERLMCKSVELAFKARESYEHESGFQASAEGNESRIKIALSLGPYGATLETAAEFTGIYPPPYGPSFSGSSSTSGPERVSVPECEEKSHEDALTAFHFGRLLVYARAVHVWDTIDVLAFETVPLVTEARAIRRAVAKLEDWFIEHPRGQGDGLRGTHGQMKRWYISFVFPGPHGEFPQHHPRANASEEPQEACNSLNKCQPYTPYEVAQAVFEVERQGLQKMATPDAIGVNCTKCHIIGDVVDGFVSLVKGLRLHDPKRFQDELPWLVVYPNGGIMYDPVRRTWIIGTPTTTTTSAQRGGTASQGAEWAESLAATLRNRNAGRPPPWATVFGGLLVGGCCKTGPREIRALKEALSTP